MRDKPRLELSEVLVEAPPSPGPSGRSFRSGSGSRVIDVDGDLEEARTATLRQMAASPPDPVRAPIHRLQSLILIHNVKTRVVDDVFASDAPEGHAFGEGIASSSHRGGCAVLYPCRE